MKKIFLIIGARPNFMKAFPVYQALKEDFDLTLIHTGQHFDEKMSKVFFEQLKFPKPDIHLTLDKRTKAGDYHDKLYVDNDNLLDNKDSIIEELTTYPGDLGQLGEIRDKLKTEFEKGQPDLVIVFGDVTSTLAAGLAAKMLNIELAHVESGLRSGDIKMPEEVNRILTDHVTKYYFVTEQSGVYNLSSCGITENVYLVGNTMIDTQKQYLQQALDTKYHEQLGVNSKEYVLITLHRPSNVDDTDKLREIFDDFQELSKTEKLVYPIHPRTKKNLKKIGYLEKVENNKNIILQDPLGYLEFTCLMANCKYVVTDSGGLQEETTALDIPCFTLRENTERPCTLIENHGTNQMIHKISEIELNVCKGSMDLWDGKSSDRIQSIIIQSIDIINAPKYKHTIFHPKPILILSLKSNIDVTMLKSKFTNYLNKKNIHIFSDEILNDSFLTGYYFDDNSLLNFNNNNNRLEKEYTGCYTYYELINNKIIIKTDYFGNSIKILYHTHDLTIFSNNYKLVIDALNDLNINYNINQDYIINEFNYCIDILNSKSIRPSSLLDQTNSHNTEINDLQIINSDIDLEINTENEVKKINKEIYDIIRDRIKENEEIYNQLIIKGYNEIKNNMINLCKKYKNIHIDLTAGGDSRYLLNIIVENNLNIEINTQGPSDSKDVIYSSFFLKKFGLKRFDHTKYVVDLFDFKDVHSFNIDNNTHIYYGNNSTYKYDDSLIKINGGFAEIYRPLFRMHDVNKYTENMGCNLSKNNIINEIKNHKLINDYSNIEINYFYYRNKYHYMNNQREFNSINILQSKSLFKATRFMVNESYKIVKDILCSKLKPYNINNSQLISGNIKLSDVNVQEYIDHQNNVKKNKNIIKKKYPDKFIKYSSFCDHIHNFRKTLLLTKLTQIREIPYLVVCKHQIDNIINYINRNKIHPTKIINILLRINKLTKIKSHENQ